MNVNKNKIRSSSTGNTTAVHSTDQEMVRKIFERYIDKPVEIARHHLVTHPFWWIGYWEDTVQEILQKANGVQQVDQMIKAMLKGSIYSHSLEDTMLHLDPHCIFSFLREAKEYLSTDDFSPMYRLASNAIGFGYEYCADKDRPWSDSKAAIFRKI